MVSAAHWHNLEGCPIIVTENVIEYRKAVSEYVTSEDVVLEVGCAEGLTTALISQISKQAFGIDKSEGQASKASERHKHIHNLHFRQIDGWDLTAVRQLSKEFSIKFNVIFIDVSGNRKVGDVESLLVKYEQVFQPRLFVVKCYQLKRLVCRCQLFTPVQSGAGPDRVQLAAETTAGESEAQARDSQLEFDIAAGSLADGGPSAGGAAAATT